MRNLAAKLVRMVEEDLGGYRDPVLDALPELEAEAEIINNESCVVAGVEELKLLFEEFGIKTLYHVDDGQRLEARSRAFLIRGKLRSILLVERVALNLLGRMSGIATLTRKFVEEARRYKPTLRIAATRKTTPLLRYFEKRAVEIGGGDPHRFDLSQMAILKRNHIVAFKSVEEAVRKAKAKLSFASKLEVEVDNAEDAVSAARAGADVVMLDNVAPSEVRRALEALEREGLRKGVLVEVSGGINLENLKEYAKLDVDVISLGKLTTSAAWKDFSLRIKTLR